MYMPKNAKTTRCIHQPAKFQNSTVGLLAMIVHGRATIDDTGWRQSKCHTKSWCLRWWVPR